jgi:hypothetical protein
LQGGTAPAARVGSTVNVFFPPIVPFSGVYMGQPITRVLQIVTPRIGIVQDGNPDLLRSIASLKV